MAKFSLSVDRPSADGLSKQSDTIPVVAWRQLADLAKSTSKGQVILVDGRISTRTYDDNEGIKHYVTEVEARDIKLFGDASAFTETPSMMPASERKAPPTKQKAVAPLDETAFDFGEKSNAPFDFEQMNEEIPF